MENTQTVPAPGVSPAPDVSTRDGAKLRLSDLTKDRDFGKRYINGDGAARKEFDSLTRTASLGEPPPAPATGPLTPDAAKEKIAQLKSDPAWAKRYLENPNGPEGREFNSLANAATSQPESASVEAKEPSEPGVPKDPSGYRFVDRVPEGSEKVADSYRDAAHAAGFTPGEFIVVNEQALIDERAYEGLNQSEIETKLDADLHRVWGSKYEQMTALVERYVADYEREHPGTLALINEHGLAYNKSLIVFLGHKAMIRYGLKD